MDLFKSREISSERGNVLALVLVVAAGLAISMISMHSFVSNRTLQIRRTVDGLKQGEIAMAGLLEIHQSFLQERPAPSSSHSLTIDGLKAEIFIEERISEETRWLGGDKPGKYQMLDSLHYLSQVCDQKSCWVAAAEEVFSPEPRAFHHSYDSFDMGFPTTSKQPVRMFSHLTRLGPGDWKTILAHQCLDLRERDCRLKLLERLREKNYQARQREYSQSALLSSLSRKVPSWPPRLEEAYLLQWMKAAESQKTMELPELYWMAGSFERLLKFQAPGSAPAQEVSIRKPQNIFSLSEAEMKILKQWFEVPPIATSQPPFRETYFHQDIHPLRHLSREGKWEAALYSNPQKFPRKMSMDRNLSLYALQYTARCSTLQVKTPEDFLRLHEDFHSQKRFFRLPECGSDPVWDVEILAKGTRLRESPMVFVGEKPWISLSSLWMLYEKSGGVRKGQFPDQSNLLDRESEEDGSRDVSRGILVFPIYQKSL